MIVQTIKNFLSLVGVSAISAVSWVVLTLMTNILVGVDYDVRRLVMIILSIIISLVISFFLGQSAGVNLTADGKFKFKTTFISHGIALAIYLLISLSIKDLNVHDISGIKAYIFNYAKLFASLSIKPFYGMLICLALATVCRVSGMLVGHKITLEARPDLKRATEFSDNGSFVDPDTNKKTWRDSVK